MADPSLVFPASEYRDRVVRLQAGMTGKEIDALLLTNPADIFYVTGFLTRFWESPARPWFVVIPSRGIPTAVIPAIGADLMGKTWITQIVTWPAPDPSDDGVSLLSNTLCDLVRDGGRIGVPMGLETHLRMPLADFWLVSDLIGSRVFVDATDAVHRVREVKSPAEIDKIRNACALAGRAFAQVPDFAAADVGLDDIFRAFQIALLEAGADWVSYVAGGAGSGGYGDVISPAGPTPLQSGDILMLDTGAVKDGYFCDFDRNYAIGPVAPETATCHQQLWHATEAALSAARPGMRACDLHRVMADALIKEGATPLGGRLGHGLGVTLTEWPSLTALDQTELREGMVLTLEPGAEIAPGRILVHEENLVLRRDGAELLSPRAPEYLPQIL